MIEEKLSRISKEKAEETFLLEETKGQEASVKTNPAAVKAKDSAEMPKPVENVKELAEKQKEPTEKAQEAPQNVKPKPAAVKTKEAAESKEPAEKAQEAPQYVKPKPAAVKTKEAAEKPMPAENWIEGNIDWVGEAIDSISAAYLDDELHDWPRVVEPINTLQPFTPKRVFSSPSKGYVKPVKTVNTPDMC
nr:cytochrome P450 [Tanacetum cinerariifolium]